MFVCIHHFKAVGELQMLGRLCLLVPWSIETSGVGGPSYVCWFPGVYRPQELEARAMFVGFEYTDLS